MSEQGHVVRRFLSVQDSAEYLGLAPKTLYTWAERGTIPAYKLGRLWRFDREELDRFVRGANNEVYIQSVSSAVGLGGREALCRSARTHEQGNGITGSTEEGLTSKVDSGLAKPPNTPKPSN